MNPALAGVALAITIGAIVAVSVRDARAAILGLAVLLIGSPFLADPLADTLGLAARVVGAVLAAYLLWIALRTAAAPTGGSRLGWAAEAALAAAAATVGYGTHGLGVAGQGPALAQAAGFALAALAVAPLWTGRDVMRVGIGLLLLMDGALLVRVALGGTPGALEQLVTAGLIAGLGGAIAILAVSASRDGGDGFELSMPGRPRADPARGRPPRRPAVTLALFLAITFGATGLALLVSRRRVPSAVVGLGGLGAAVIAALALDPNERVTVGGAVVATSDYLRLFLILGSSVGLVLALVGFATGSRRDAPAVTLGTLGAAALAMSLADPRIAVLALTAGGLLAVLLTVVPGGNRAAATIGVLELRALIVAGAMAVAAAAWIGRDLSQLVAQPVVFGLAYLAFALAVAIRFGAIPFHIWAARLTDTVPEMALPIVTAWGPAAFAVVALAWTDQSVAPLLVEMDAERGIVLAVAVATIVLAAFAAWIQDDLEHVVGYSIIGDAGVVLLAIAALDPDAWAPARIWILAYVVTRSAFAAWAASLRATYGTGRIPSLRGWAVRSPVLALALGLIVLAGIGLPGLAAFDARASLVHLAVPDPFAAIVLLATFAPLAYEARLFVIGARRPPAEVPAPVGRGGLPRRTALDVNDLRGSAGTFWTVNRAALASLLTVALALGSLVVAAGGLGGPAAAAGVAPGAEGPSESFEPAPEPGASFEIPSPVPGEASPGDSFQPIPTN